MSTTPEPRGTDLDLLDRRAVHTASSAVTAMTIFVASEAVFFSAFLGIYANAYTNAKTWPPADVTAPSIALPSVGVGILVVSALAMAQAMRRVRRTDYPRGVASRVGVVVVCAVTFAVLTAISYAQLGFGVGRGIYESLSYMFIGLELAHVIGGVALLGLVLARAATGELALRRDPVQAAAIYWYFVVGLGVVLYLVLYVAAG